MNSLMFLAVLTSLPFVPAPWPYSNRGNEDLVKMQGEWVLISAETEGASLPTNHLRMLIVGCRLKMDSDVGVGQWLTVTLNDERQPRNIDLDPGTGEPRMKCAYDLKGNNLKICFSVGSRAAARPQQVSPPGADDYLMIFQRRKK